ncbi:hypothetical protein HOY80DRAFT_1053609 [Tuber brumale]|nr:hypothetical protein HOY80DRAFT_1053609 [Tuber brumale]
MAAEAGSLTEVVAPGLSMVDGCKESVMKDQTTPETPVTGTVEADLQGKDSEVSKVDWRLLVGSPADQSTSLSKKRTNPILPPRNQSLSFSIAGLGYASWSDFDCSQGATTIA